MSTAGAEYVCGFDEKNIAVKVVNYHFNKRIGVIRIATLRPRSQPIR
jgi:hypothetical protein